MIREFKIIGFLIDIFWQRARRYTKIFYFQTKRQEKEHRALGTLCSSPLAPTSLTERNEVGNNDGQTLKPLGENIEFIATVGEILDHKARNNNRVKRR